MNWFLKIITTLLFLILSLCGLCEGNEINKPFNEENQIYCSRLDSALQEAIILAKDFVHENSCFIEYDTHPGDSSFAVTVTISMGHLFSKKQKHLLIRRSVLWSVYLDMFLVTDTNLIQVISREQEGLSYLNDTIRDINGDGYKDFLVHWYPFRGDYKRDVYSVYLYQAGDGTFTLAYRFINPTFSPKEKVIRGVEYGYPGRAGLYKFKWNGLQIDPVEFIYPDVNNKGQFIKTRESTYRLSEKEGERLNAVPQEYLHIEGYKWFIDY
jgi:hypothetical protein